MSDGTSSLGGEGARAPSSGHRGAPRAGGQPGGIRRNLALLWIVLPLLVLAIAVVLLMRGCETEVAIHYGSRQALYEGDESINGLGVLSEMFSQAGHRVSSTTRLTPKI